jgi:large repetitive protein
MKAVDGGSLGWTRRSLAACIAAAALLLMLASSAEAKKAVTVSCGETITTDTKLANDLTDCPNNGIVIGADDIALDLHGHTIDSGGVPPEGCSEDEICGAGVVNGAGEGGRAVIAPGHDGVTIKNGTIQEFGEAIFSYAASDNRLRDLTLSNNVNHGVTWPAMTHSRIEGIRARGSLLGILVGGVRGGAHDIRVEHNSVSDNEFLGISVFGGSDHVLVARNSVSDTADGAGIVLSGSDENRVERNQVTGNLAGIVIADGSAENVVTHNRSSGNVFDGLALEPETARNLVTNNLLQGNGVTGMFVIGSDDNRIERNSVVGNGDGTEAGIHLFVPPDEPGNTADGNLIADNSVSGNEGDGILFDADQTQNVLEGNAASENTDDGIDIESPSTTLTGNTANRNHDLGIEAVPGVTDGGGNRAQGNGNPLECTNVFCN